MLTVADWLQRLDGQDTETRKSLARMYGANQSVVQDRVRLTRLVLTRFGERFGDAPVRVFRSPGRINLRGMHVDTHGGYINLMTHQREVVIAAAPSEYDEVRIANCDDSFSEVTFRIGEFSSHTAFSGEWNSFILSPDVHNAVWTRRGHWGNYLQGCVLSAQHRFRDTPLRGMRAVVGSDLPRGAALSSSAALSVALLKAVLGLNTRTLSTDEAILAVRDAEWYAGSRIGVSDQAAMLLGGKDTLVNTALLASRLDTSSARRIPFPDALRILVVNSYTERSLSGAQLVEYTRNRFAYSLALDILRQEMRADGLSGDAVSEMDCLAAITADAFASHGGVSVLYRLLRRVPLHASLSELKRRYDLPAFDTAYADFFGTVPVESRPEEIDLRGPLMFGIAESERARLFPEALEQRDFVRAGRLMSTGHNGDRRITGAGQPYRYDVSDAAMEHLAAEGAPIEWCPGVYGASSPVLDTLVDEALEAGALGACLTGAGIAGAVLALCHAEDAEGVAEAIRARMARPDYAKLTNREAPLTEAELSGAVVVNYATAGAGELVL
ncbi:MAG: hypothetical protein HZB26_07695 [Candidatus Hydrogenedentes bacterium]|nr:hypothetical protein [Candidatus Hydrogenedentota bacterium]